ncbi:hypothetical protein QQ008_19695 [Fulvivirgaceae bacterium BMA10]|uniref:DUF2975 domain-containing protein n=1 Tax=Splendidivirga corallicola TaxID=3051826 RepID=A0ABT8KS81_9BACT|nr:hypothetical protein [Fulvivirgaceae bacterium BMA10]
MDKLIKIFRVISTLVFFVALLLGYGYLPSKLHLPFVFESRQELYMEKSTLFYIVLGLFFIITFSCTLLSYYLKSTAFLANNNNPDQNSFRRQLKNWINSFLIVFNIYLLFAIGVVGVINNTENVDISNYAFFAYTGPILLTIWLIILLIILLRKLSFKKELT